MALTYKAKGGGGDFKSVSPGSHFAVCDQVIDLGLQPGFGAFPDPKNKVYIRFEIPTERVDYKDKNGKDLSGPAVIGNRYTASMHEKANLRKQLESWRGKKFSDDEAENFDVSTILGKPCMLAIVENVKGDKVYSNIQSISGLPKGVEAPKAELDLVYFSDGDQSSTHQIEQLPEWIQKLLSERVRPQASHATGSYAQPDQAGKYDFGSTGDGTEITDADIPEWAADEADPVPF